MRGASPSVQEVLEALREGPCPQEAVARALGLPASVPGAAFTPALGMLMHQGSYPARLLSILPQAWDVLAPKALPSPGRQVLREAIATQAAEHGLAEALGRVRTREYLRLCRAEVEGAPLEAVGGDLCRLAEACIDASLDAEDLGERVAVLGMGKLGGGELNFLSDIDLVFVHDDAVGTSSRRERVALHEGLRKVVRLLEGEGRFRPVFRVDLRLRPFGARGALSLSSAATEAYYERHGRAWERQVWLRARHVGGNEALSSSLLTFLRPFVYRRSVTPAIFDEIAELMHRARRRGRSPRLDLKLDEGGIRTVEFSVQALQLLHGGRDATMRTLGTLPALDRAFAAGLLSDREHRDLERAYRTLRRIEHRLQLTDGAHTHSLPDSEEGLTLLARRLAAPQGPYPLDASAFAESVTLARQVASAVASSIAPPLAPEGSDPRAGDREVVLDLGAPADRREAALARLGVRDPAEVEALLQHLASRDDGAWTSRGDAGQGFEALLRACLDSADPDGAVARLVEFSAHRPAHYAVWRFLADPDVQERDMVRLMAELFGTSAALSRGLIGLTQTTGDAGEDSIGVLMGAGLAKLPDAESLSRDAEDFPVDPRGFEATLRRFMERQRVAIALFDLGQQPDALEVGRALSSLADLCVRQVLRDVVAEVAHERPAAHGLRLGVFAVGKYGVEAMDYGSDLDLIFVFDGPQPQREAIRVGQRFLARLTERRFGVRLYEVDMRLRPSGRQGLLVSSLEGFTRYHAKPLPVWERLALLPLRPIGEAVIEGRHQPPLAPPDAAGDAVASAVPGDLCHAVAAVVARSLTQPLAHAEVAREVRSLKRRIEAEIARETRDVRNAKSGAGAALELELLAGALSLELATGTGATPPRGVPAQLDALHAAGRLPAAQSRALCAAYAFQRRFLNRLRMSPPAAGSDPDRFAQNSPRLRTLARRMGLTGPDDLLARFAASTQAVRAAFDEHLEG